MTRMEALALAIARTNDWLEPDSLAFSLGNPGLLKAFKLTQPMDANQYRIFESSMDGLQALIFDLGTKCSGHSRSKLKTDSTLTDLMAVYGHPIASTGAIVKFLRKALRDSSVADKTPLSFFLPE